MKKIISLVLLISWMTLIFSLSSKNGEESGSMSTELIKTVVKIVTNIESEEKLDKIADKYSFIVRKCAHFFEYFVLSFLTINVLYSFDVKKFTILYAALFCVIYAITDEVHQLFVGERSGQISDVLLDSSASLIGSYIFNKLYILRGKHEKKNN